MLSASPTSRYCSGCRRMRAQLLPGEKGEERERDEQQRVLDRTLAALIDIDGLVQPHTERGLRQHRFVDFALRPGLSIGSIQLEHLPARLEAARRDAPLDRQECTLKRRMRPIRTHGHGRRAAERQNRQVPAAGDDGMERESAPTHSMTRSPDRSSPRRRARRRAPPAPSPDACSAKTACSHFTQTTHVRQRQSHAGLVPQVCHVWLTVPRNAAKSNAPSTRSEAGRRGRRRCRRSAAPSSSFSSTSAVQCRGQK